MHSYFAYGIGIRSEIRLPELNETDGPRDLVIRLSSPQQSTGEESSTWTIRLEPHNESIVLTAGGFGAFASLRGEQICITPAPDADERLIALFVLGTVLPIALHQRGYYILHGSCVRIGRDGCAFLGRSGWGKSTTAAALCARGHSLLADDVTALKMEAGQALVYPGFPQVKLSDPVASSLGIQASTRRRLHASEPRHGYPVPFVPLEPHRVNGIYVLCPGDRMSIDPLGSAEAMVELARHSSFSETARLYRGADQFRRCAQLARLIPTYRLRSTHCFSDLPALAALVEEHALRAEPAKPSSDGLLLQSHRGTATGAYPGLTS